MRLITLTFAALAAVAPGFARADDADDGPDRRCRVLADAAPGDVATSTPQADGKPFVLPIEVHCEDLDQSTTPIRIESVVIEYHVKGDRIAPVPRTRKQQLHGTCAADGTPLRLEVTLLTADQKHRDPLRGLAHAVTYEASLSLHARQRKGNSHRCFGSMQWTFEVRPGAS